MSEDIMVCNKKKNMTTSSSAPYLLGAILGGILVFAASPATAQANAGAPWTTDCSKKPAEEFYNCQYCTDQIPSSKGVYFSTASTDRISRKNRLECKPVGNSEAEANAPAPSGGLWADSSYDRVQACLAIPATQRADLVEEGWDNALNTTWRTPNDQICTANANQACQDYATAAYMITNTWVATYGGNACFFYANDQGPKDPRWSKHWQDHYDWCVNQTAVGNLSAVTQEAKIRFGTIDNCQRQNGQPDIDPNTAQPVPSPAPPQRTHAFQSPVPVPPPATGEGNTMIPRNRPNSFAPPLGSGFGASATNPRNPFGSGSGGGAPNTANPNAGPNGGNPAGSGGGSGGLNTGGYYPNNPNGGPNGGNPAGSGGGGGGLNTGGYYPNNPNGGPNGGNSAGGSGGGGPNARPPHSNGGNPAGSGGSGPNARGPQPNGGNTSGSGGGGPNARGPQPNGGNTSGSGGGGVQPQPPKNPVLTNNRPNPFATPGSGGNGTMTTNVRSFTQTHEHANNGGSHHEGGHHSGGHHGGSHHSGGHHSGGHHRSDIRLKHDITLLGHLDNGLGFYRFSYNGSDKVYVGVMAQEVQAEIPEAVERGRDGYLLVLYPKLGLKFQTYEQWIASGAHVPAGPTLQH